MRRVSQTHSSIPSSTGKQQGLPRIKLSESIPGRGGRRMHFCCLYTWVKL